MSSKLCSHGIRPPERGIEGQKDPLVSGNVVAHEMPHERFLDVREEELLNKDTAKTFMGRAPADSHANIFVLSRAVNPDDEDSVVLQSRLGDSLS